MRSAAVHHAVAFVTGVALGGIACGRDDTLGAEALAEAIAHELSSQGLSARVTCPTGATGDGAEIACTAVAADDPSGSSDPAGPAGPAIVVRAQLGDDGRVSLRPESALAIARAAPAIRRALADLGIDAVRIDCARVLARPGDPLRCEIEAQGGGRFRWDAVVDADGHARGELVPR